MSTETPQSDEVTEDEHLVTDKIDDYNLLVPHVIEIATNLNTLDEESESITDRINRIKSSTPRPGGNSYHLAITRNPYISVTDVSQSQSVDPIATQMDRIANLAPSLKAVTHTEPPVWRRTTTEIPNIWRHPITVTRSPAVTQSVTGTAVTPVAVSHTQIPRPGGVNVIINPPVAHISTEPHYQLNLLPIHLNRIPGAGQYMNTKQQAAAAAAAAAAFNEQQQQQTNFNLFGSSVLKHIVEQSSVHQKPPASIDQENTERLVSALFNKYLANKTFIKKNGSNGLYFVSPMDVPQSNENTYPGIRHVPISLRIKHGEGGTESNQQNLNLFPSLPPATPRPETCVPGVRFPNSTDCRRYYMCNASNAGIHVYTCPPYTAFDKVRRMCDVAQYARCVNPFDTEYNIDGSSVNSYQESLIKVQLPPDEACDTRDKLPDPTSPRRYILCIKSHDGRWNRHQMTCPGLLIFCPTRNFCSPKSNCY